MKTSNSITNYNSKFLTSRELSKRASNSSRGNQHDARNIDPFPLYIESAKGSKTYDVDGHEFIDYTMGHGALFFGHAHPLLIKTVNEQISKGTHYGAENKLALEWCEIISELIPSAQKVEFTSSGTEANLLIAQIARAYTGRHKIAKFERHFLGWSDHMLVGFEEPCNKATPGRLPPIYDSAVSDATCVIPINDISAMENLISNQDIAALFLEGGGAFSGTIAMPYELVHKAKRLCEKYGTILVIDEVVTGLRWSTSGYQGTVDIVSDMSSLGKVVSGGLPGGAAICGRSELIDMLKIKVGNKKWNRYERVPHPGTWNGNPLNAAAGVAILKELSSGEPQKRAESLAEKLAIGMNTEIRKRNLEACVYNTSSTINIHIGECKKNCETHYCYDTGKKCLLNYYRR